MLLHFRGAEVLHASAIRIGPGVVGFCADSGTGKSTTALGLAHRGFAAWADDTLVVSHGERFESIGLPFSFRIEPDVVAFYAREESLPSTRHPDAPVDVAPLAALCVLRRDDSNPGLITRLGSAEAFRRIIRHAFSFHVDDGLRNARLVDSYMTLCEALPIFEITNASDLYRLPLVLDGVERNVLRRLC